MKNIKKIIKETILETMLSKSYEIIYSDGIRQKKTAKDISSAKKIAKELTNKPNMKDVEIFKSSPGFHSTTQEEYLIAWWGDGSYWDNMSKKNPELLKKKLQ